MSSRGFRVLPSYYEAVRCFQDDQRLILWDAIMDFGCAGILPENLPPACNAVFTLMQPTIAKSVKFFEDQQIKAQSRQDKIRQSANGLPEDCRTSADNGVKNNGGTLRGSASVVTGASAIEGAGVSELTAAAALLQQFGIVGDNEFVETIVNDLSRHGEEIVREALKRAKNTDGFGGVTPKFYVSKLLEVLREYKRKPSPAREGYQSRDYSKADFAAMEVDLDAAIDSEGLP